MALEIWIAFVFASTVMLLLPGPTVMLVVSYAMGQGRRTGWATVPGVVLGDFTAMTLSLMGAGALLATSATLFTALKLAGAAYLIWLGYGMWRAHPHALAMPEQRRAQSQRRIFRNAYIVTALNPKSIIFFVAFVPQFVTPDQPALSQFIVLEVTFLTMVAINITLWTLLAGGLRQLFQTPRSLKRLNRVAGSCLMGAGVLTAAVRRAA